QRLKEGQSPAFLVIESSGTNRAVNEFVKKYPHLTIWVESDFYKDRNILEARKYASELNKYLENRLKNHELQFDFIFNVNGKKFKKNIYTNANQFSDNLRAPSEYKTNFSSSYNLLFKEDSKQWQHNNNEETKMDYKTISNPLSSKNKANYNEFPEEFKIAFKGLPKSAFK
ncbi:MAG: hypothetical protein ACTSVC_09800, partial [Promethearchaeota archaeon]